MRRALLILAGIAALTWLQFEFVPGHTYLQSDTQVYVPILEKLDSPGLLSRDLVATHPNVTYTIYDEVTLFLHEVLRLDLETALVAQQIVFRAAGLLGVLFLAQSTGIGDLFSLLIAGVVNLGAFLSGPDISMISREPTPTGFAFGLVLLAIGLFAKQKALLAGLAGGLAFVYDPRVAVPLWLAVLAMLLFDRSVRPLIRPSLTIFAIFVLLLANLAQLQPGAPDSHGLLERIATPIARIEQFRTSYVWVSTWAARQLWKYLVLGLVGFFAARRIWPVLNRQTRWFTVVLPLIGILSVPASYILLERARWYLIPQIQPMQTLVFVVFFAWVTCALAGLRAAEKRSWAWALPFLGFAVLIPLTTFEQKPVGGQTRNTAVGKLGGTEHLGRFDVLVSGCRPRTLPGRISGASQTRRMGRLGDWETGGLLRYFRGRMVSPLAGHNGKRVFRAASVASVIASDRLLCIGPRPRLEKREARVCHGRLRCLRRGNAQEYVPCIAARSSVKIDPELLQLFGVIAPMKNVVFFTTLGDLPLLSLDFLARRFVYPVFQLQQIADLANQRQPKLISVFADTEIARFPH